MGVNFSIRAKSRRLRLVYSRGLVALGDLKPEFWWRKGSNYLKR